MLFGISLFSFLVGSIAVLTILLNSRLFIYIPITSSSYNILLYIIGDETNPLGEIYIIVSVSAVEESLAPYPAPTAARVVGK